MYICMYICVYTYIYVYIHTSYICMYVYTYILPLSKQHLQTVQNALYRILFFQRSCPSRRNIPEYLASYCSAYITTLKLPVEVDRSNMGAMLQISLINRQEPLTASKYKYITVCFLTIVLIPVMFWTWPLACAGLWTRLPYPSPAAQNFANTLTTKKKKFIIVVWTRNPNLLSRSLKPSKVLL